MKSQKGVTLTSLVMYVIGMTLVLTIIITLTTFVINNLNSSSKASAQYTRFSSIFLKDINRSDNIVMDCKTEGSRKQ